MEVVLLAHITLNRIGSASFGGGFSGSQCRTRKFSAELAEKDRDKLRNLVIEIAEQHGETPGNLEGLQLEHEHFRGMNSSSTSMAGTPSTAPHTQFVSSNLRSKPTVSTISSKTSKARGSRHTLPRRGRCCRHRRQKPAPW